MSVPSHYVGQRKIDTRSPGAATGSIVSVPSVAKTGSVRVGLLIHLVWRAFILRYKRSVLGILWSFLSPLAQLLVLVFLFRKVIPLKIDAYPAFVFTGLLSWIWFSTSLLSSCGLFLANRDLVRRPNFEPSILVWVNTLSNLIQFLIFLPGLMTLLLLYHRPVNACLLFFPVLLIIQVVLTVGIGLLLATINVFYHDVEHLTAVAVPILFYITPVFYAPRSAGQVYDSIFRLNPVSALVQSYRSIFFYGEAPAWDVLGVAAGISVLLLVFGYFVYARWISEVYDLV